MILEPVMGRKPLEQRGDLVLISGILHGPKGREMASSLHYLFATVRVEIDCFVPRTQMMVYKKAYI